MSLCFVLLRFTENYLNRPTPASCRSDWGRISSVFDRPSDPSGIGIHGSNRKRKLGSWLNVSFGCGGCFYISQFLISARLERYAGQP